MPPWMAGIDRRVPGIPGVLPVCDVSRFSPADPPGMSMTY